MRLRSLKYSIAVISIGSVIVVAVIVVAVVISVVVIIVVPNCVACYAGCDAAGNCYSCSCAGVYHLSGLASDRVNHGGTSLGE